MFDHKLDISSLQDALREIDAMASGAPIILHTDIGAIARNYGLLRIGSDQVFDLLISELRSRVRSKNIFIPTFDYSFCKTGIYDISSGHSDLGAFSRYCAKRFPDFRTHVPVFSHVDICREHRVSSPGYALDVAFGSNSFYEWFMHEGGVVYFWGCAIDKANTFIHQIECHVGVPYRHEKVFKGSVISMNRSSTIDFSYYVRSHKVDVIYDDQGASMLRDSGLLYESTDHLLCGYRGIDSLKEIGKSLSRDIYSLLTLESKLSISDFRDETRFLSALCPCLERIRVLSDINLALAGQGWVPNDRVVEFVYASDLLLDIDAEIDRASEDVNTLSHLIIATSLDSMGLGMLSGASLVSGDNIIDSMREWSQQFIARMSTLVQSLDEKTKLIALIGLPSNSLSSICRSVQEELFIAKTLCEIQDFMFSSLANLGVIVRSASNYVTERGLCLSISNYLRYRFPFEVSCIQEIRTILLDCIDQASSSKNPIKAISVDLDNTIWNGVAGDEVPRISRDYPENSHLYLQYCIRRLKQSGIFLAATTKNEISTVRDTFKILGEQMILSYEDFDIIEAGWGAKSDSILRLSEKLNIAPSSVMHIDDSVFECNEIRSALPDVQVLMFDINEPDRCLNALRRNPRLSRSLLTDSDVARVYKKSHSAFMSRSAGDTLQYIRSLKIRLDIVRLEVGNTSIHRVEQLYHKTNQFNTSSVRMSRKLLEESACKRSIYYLKYCDINGFTEICGSLLVSYLDREKVTLDGFVLSCRFFSRGLEFVLLSKVIEDIGASAAYIVFKKSLRNAPAWNFLSQLSTQPLKEHGALRAGEQQLVEVDLEMLRSKSDTYADLFDEVRF